MSRKSVLCKSDPAAGVSLTLLLLLLESLTLFFLTPFFRYRHL
jgi:hypothetical protein